MRLASLEELLRDDPRINEDTSQRIESQVRQAASDIQNMQSSPELQPMSPRPDMQMSEVDISSRINRSGRPSSEEIQKMVESGDASALISEFQPPVDMTRKMGQTSRMASESIGNALAALGGFYTAKGGAPVTPIDRSRIDNIANQIARDEIRNAEIKNQYDMMSLQEALGQIQQKRTQQQLKEDHKMKMELEEKRQGMYDARADADIRVIEAGGLSKSQLEDQKQAGRMQMQIARNAPRYAEINSRAQRDNLRQQAETLRRNSQDNATLSRENPYSVTLYDPDQNKVIGTLRQKEANALLNELVKRPEVQRYLGDEFSIAWTQDWGMEAALPDDLRNHIIMSFWNLLPDATEVLMEQSKYAADPLRLRE